MRAATARNGKLRRGPAPIRMATPPATLRQAREINGKKHGVLGDPQALPRHAIVHAADIQDRDGGGLPMRTPFGAPPFRRKL
ncbi:MAG: hypothetical protein WBE80_00355 [Methylocella sp.]